MDLSEVSVDIVVAVDGGPLPYSDGRAHHCLGELCPAGKAK